MLEPSDAPDSSPDRSDGGLESFKILQISKRKVLYVELDEEITSIFERLKRIPYPEVYLVVPERAGLLQSIVNLQILKKKTLEMGKLLSLITNDPAGIQLAHQVEIPVFDQTEQPAKGAQKAPLPSTEDALLTPLTAVSNEIPEDRPERLTQKKVSIFDVVREVKDRNALPLKRLTQWWRMRCQKKQFQGPARFPLDGPSRKALGTLLIASLAILLVISYVALPGATVTVTSQANVIEQSVNITLANANVYGTNPSVAGGHVLVAYPLSVTLKKTLTYNSTGQLFNGTNAGGTVTLINERTSPWPLVAFTRLSTDEGLIFRTQEAITVPAATTQSYGSIEVTVVADETDAYGRVIGEKGNIGPSSFILPGLREESQKILYGQNKAAFAGGSTVVTLQVTQADLDASRELLKSQLEVAAEAELEAEVEQRNATNSTSLMLLTGYGAVTLDEPSISLPTQLVGALQDTFQVSGSLKVSGYAFDRVAFLEILTAALEERKSPDKILVKLDEDSITTELFEINTASGLLKFTATLKGLEAYDLNPETENGAELIQKIKEHIAGKPLKEAEDYVQNLPEINRARISTWPLWAPTIPTVLENIDIEVEEGMDE